MVYFVGAGPGATDLITVRGQRLLEQADVIIYAGSLVNPELLQAAKPSCQVYNSAFMTLEEVIAVMADAEKESKSCVRLHTGDPSLYGAVREQMDELEKRGIAYESCPGVSSMFAAAAAMDLEYTLPGVSQTVIVSRSAGRTPVPERESIRKLAVHQSTMVLFLSAGQLESLSEELIAGGYAPETPAAIVYKASWPEELCLKCTVESLAETARANDITKTALVIVGEVLQGNYERSKLYDPAFSTGYRVSEDSKATDPAAVQMTDPVHTPRKKAAIIAFTKEGTVLAGRIAKWLTAHGWDCEGCTTQRQSDANGHMKPLQESLRAWTGKRFTDSRALIFTGASGIAVRSIAPFVNDKMTDPAVLVIDEAAKHVIPLLAGHIGGANRLAQQLSEVLGADCVLTTATDVRKRFAVDCFAAANGLVLTDRNRAKAISAAILAGETIRISGPERWLREAELPPLLQHMERSSFEKSSGDAQAASEKYIRIDWHRAAEDEDELRLIPEKAVWIGVGCKKGTSKEALEKAFDGFLQEQDIDPRALAGLASIMLKSEEEGLLDFASARQIPLRFYEAEQLEALTGDFSDSDFVRQQTGVGNVCERAACLAARDQGSGQGCGKQPDVLSTHELLIVKKQKAEGITFAAALADRRLCFG